MAGNRRRAKKNWPLCPATGKQRLGERKDVRLALKAARELRARVAIGGGSASWTVVRGYRCTAAGCGGWHLTSSPARRAS